LCANLAAGPLPAAVDEPLLELPLLELLELALLLVLELLPLELLPLELPDLLESFRSETLLAAAPSGLSTVETPPHPAKTAVARLTATIVIFLKQKFAMSTNISTGMATLCPSGEWIAMRRDSATRQLSQNGDGERQMLRLFERERSSPR